MNPNMNLKPFKAIVKHLKDKKFYIKKVVKNGYQIQTEGDATND
jgi:sortase A